MMHIYRMLLTLVVGSACLFGALGYADEAPKPNGAVSVKVESWIPCGEGFGYTWGDGMLRMTNGITQVFTLFADHVGYARHLVVAPNGVVYVNTWSGRYYRNDTPPAGGFLVALHDTTGDGQADVTSRFGDSVESGSAGGTGIALYHGGLFAER